MNILSIRLLIILKNAALGNLTWIKVTLNSLVRQLLVALYKAGLILSFRFNVEEGPCNTRVGLVFIKYYYETSKLLDLCLLSTNVKHYNLKAFEIQRLVVSNKNLFFLTVDGVLTLSECKIKNIGGFLLFSI